jgi:hypothetical protein
VVTDKPFVRTPRAFGWVDLAVVGLLAAFIYALVTVAREWSGPLQQVPEIHLEGRYLPLYALFSLSRGVMAYGVSFLFTSARRLSEPAHRLDHRDGRRVERQHRRGIHEVSQPDAEHDGAGRGDQPGD